MKTIGLITIGQSPRIDVTEDIGAFFSEEVTVLEAGALDHITEAELQDMRPEGNETALVSRMRDGRQVIFAEKHILRLLHNCAPRRILFFPDQRFALLIEYRVVQHSDLVPF